MPETDGQNEALDLVFAALADMSEDRQVSVVIEQQVQLHRPFGLTKLRPVKKTGAKINDARVQT